MALPDLISCKVSDEGAGYVTMTAVNHVDVPVARLVGKILAVTGKNPDRIAKILARGSLVSEDSRFRWVGIDVTGEDLSELLATFPHDDPTCVFDPARCVRIEFAGARGRIEISRDVGRETRVLRRKNFWDEAMPLLAASSPRYDCYSYSDATDIFIAELSREAIEQIRSGAGLIRYTSLEMRLKNLQTSQVVLYQPR